MASSNKISQNEVRELAVALDPLTTEKAKELFFHLKVQLKTLDDIDANNSGIMRKIHYVQAWHDGEMDANWEKIVTGLKLVGMYSLAESLSKEKISTLSSSGVTTSSLPSPPATLPKEDDLPLNNLSLEPAARPPSPPFPPSDRVAQVKEGIKHFRDSFYKLLSETQKYMALKESVDPSFLKEVIDRLLALPVAQKVPHVKFFRESEDDFLKAENVRKLIAILKRYCNCFNYEILLVVIVNFCEAALQHRMQDYCQSLEMFERRTTVDVYLEAISAGPVVSSEFRKMAVTINKPANQCTLYEVRKLKEAAAERASLQPYSVYIGDISVSSVKVELAFPASCVGWILGAMTPDFLSFHHLSQVVLGQDMLAIVDRPNKELNGELIEASKSRDLVRVTSLLNSGADVHTIEEDYGKTLIFHASDCGYLDLVRVLISRGAQPNYRDKFDNTALMFAAARGNTAIVKELLSLGADPNVQNLYGDTAVIGAVAENEEETLKEIVMANSDLNLQNKHGLTALMIAVRGGKTEMVNILLKGDRDIQENTEGWTALHLSAENGDSATTHALIRAGANVHIKAKNGWTALEVAEVKSVDKDTELIPPWDEHYTIPYGRERDYEMVIQLLRGKIVILPTTLQETESKKKEEELEVKDEVKEDKEVKLKRECRSRQGRGREIMEKTMEKSSDNQTSSSAINN